MAKMFEYSLSHLASDFSTRGYVFASRIISQSFLDYCTDILNNSLQDLGIEEKSVFLRQQWMSRDNSKTQLVFDFPPNFDLIDDLFKPLSELTGESFDAITISERHIKIYKPDAKSAFHKDRLASQLVISIPIFLDNRSDLMFVNTFRDLNPFSTRSQYENLQYDKQDIDPEMIEFVNARPLDAVFFKGSSIFHNRSFPNNGVVLCIKTNSMNLDPLCEDYRTQTKVETSKKLLLSKPKGKDLLCLKVDLSPLFDGVIRHYTRVLWREILECKVWGSKSFEISEIELLIIKHIDKKQTVNLLIDRIGNTEKVESALIHLAEMGVVVLSNE